MANDNFGIFFLIYGIYDLFTPMTLNCPMEGRSPLPAIQILDFFWPAFASTTFGVALVATGTILVTRGRAATRALEAQMRN